MAAGLIYYVYYHIHPRTNQVVYIGMGSGQRAWMMRNSTSTGPRYGHRSQKHYNWFQILEYEGHTLDQIVLIEKRGLSKDKARELESNLIKQFNPMFNIHKGCGSMVDFNKIEKALALKQQGLTYKQIAEQMNLSSPASAWRYINAY